jgi:2-oxo-3-hexenedioate decarboxylase
MGTISELALALDRARLGRSFLQPIAVRHQLSVADAYAVQSEGVRLRLQRGERIIGYKLGFTREAMRRQMNVQIPNFAILTDAMKIAPGGAVDSTKLVQPRVEPEVAVLMRHDLSWPTNVSQAANSIEACATALELVDSRFPGYVFTFEDNTADNSSAAGFALGEWVKWPCDLDAVTATLYINEKEVERGLTSAVMGHPLNALVEAARLASSIGLSLKKNSIVLTGGLTAAPYIRKGDIARGVISTLGSAHFSMT